jgi:hypothetical protein
MPLVVGQDGDAPAVIAGAAVDAVRRHVLNAVAHPGGLGAVKRLVHEPFGDNG